MNYNRFIYAIVFILAINGSALFAQNKQTITIEFANAQSSPDKDSGALILLRDDSRQVHFKHKGIDMWCDKALYFEKQNYIEAFSNVSMKQGDSIHMNAKYVEYNGDTQLALAQGNVILKEPSSTLTTEKLYFDKALQIAYYTESGKVVKDSSGTITSKIGRYYMQKEKYQFTKEVELVHPNYILNTNRLDYYPKNGYAYLYGPSTITGDKSKVYCERGFYDTENDYGYFEKNAKIDYEHRKIVGDSLYFNRVKNFASATNNITVTDTLNNSVVKGHYAEVWKEKDSVLITKRAVAITVQEQDSVYIHADTLLVTGKPENRITRAYYNVKLFKSDLSGKADSIHVDHKSGLTKMINLNRFSTKDAFAAKRKPILWNLGNQMTGDTIHLISNVKTEKLDSLKVFNNAFLISQDTISKEGFNQIKGKQLIGLFKENELYQVDIIKNAETIRYMYNETNELIGIQKSKSGNISVFLIDQAIDEVRFINQIDGNIYPDSEFPKSGRKLRGFDWRGDEQLLSVDDLFKDDKPFTLPVIKGLSPYIPPEEFDNSKMESINPINKKKKGPISKTVKKNSESNKSFNTLLKNNKKINNK